jgi:hypothetical protein
VAVGGGAALLQDVNVDTIVAKHLIIQDAGGVERMRLEVTGPPLDSAGVRIVSPAGEQLYLGAALVGDAGLKIYSPNPAAPPSRRIELGTRPSTVAGLAKTAALELISPGGPTRVALGIEAEPAGLRSGLEVIDGNGAMRLEAITMDPPVVGAGVPSQAVLKNTGNPAGGVGPFLSETLLP